METGPKDTLKKEIMMLRSRMELAALNQTMLTSDEVMLASRQLDQKINEYMRLYSGKSKES